MVHAALCTRLNLVFYEKYGTYWVPRNSAQNPDAGIYSGRTSWFLDLWFSLGGRPRPILFPMGIPTGYCRPQHEKKTRASEPRARTPRGVQLVCSTAVYFQ